MIRKRKHLDQWVPNDTFFPSIPEILKYLETFLIIMTEREVI
jgi:hypothetical protein